VKSVPVKKYLKKGYTMACFTALSVKLHQHQLYILIVIMDAKLNKNFNSMQKNIKNLIFILILNKIFI